MISIKTLHDYTPKSGTMHELISNIGYSNTITCIFLYYSLYEIMSISETLKICPEGGHYSKSVRHMTNSNCRWKDLVIKFMHRDTRTQVVLRKMTRKSSTGRCGGESEETVKSGWWQRATNCLCLNPGHSWSRFNGSEILDYFYEFIRFFVPVHS